jgi:hypothetical protein
LFGLVLTSCKDKQKLFEIIHSQRSGITFNNHLEINDTINGVVFEYVYNGAGLAVGDVNNDGLNDLFFAGNMVSSQLYLNQGSLTFKDITAKAGVSTDRWCTGTSFIDINADGLLDLYICVAGLGTPEVKRNIFFINQGVDELGIPHFKDLASEMNLADDGYSTMAVFFDYDKDQDLDVYILTNAMEAKLRNALRPRRVNGEGPSTDRLYRNDGNGHFTNVSREAGILQEGYGLGIGICDINQDGWTDVYCSNDFLSNDLLWINNRNGTFSEESATYFKHFTNNGMGMDIADYNNDGLLDIIVLDMLPMSNQRQKQMIGYRNLTRFYESLDMGYHPQFLRNTLQLNRGKFDDEKFRFSEIGYLTGVYQTDWSWSPLLADYDNDGWKDLSITNGYRKDVTNLDYIYFTLQENMMFGTRQAKREQAISAMKELPDVQLPNFIFNNNKDLTFTDKSKEWGLDYPTFTNGTAYADLDEDGDLDLVINNIDQEVIIFKNLTSEKKDHHFLKVKFDRSVKDFEKIGLKIWAYHQQNTQYYEYSPYRGYKSTVSPEILIGLGNSKSIDSLIIQWPDGSSRKWQDLDADTTLWLRKDHSHAIAPGHIIPGFNKETSLLKFTDQTEAYHLKIKHEEHSRKDLDQIPIIMHNLGQYGPGIAVGDVNRDGLEDLFVGNDSNFPGFLILQQPDKTFSQIPFPIDSVYEDLGALFFDPDQDGDLDLYVVSGGSNWNDGDLKYQDRLYLNDGAGHFTRSEDALPSITSSGSCVIAGDYDIDGDLDLFVGGRITPNKYPSTPKSYLLENQDGKFKDVSSKLGIMGGYIGMVSSALWTDLNGDPLPDLIITGEYMPITVLINEGTKFNNQTADYQLENTSGWWNSIHGADLDHDGDIDYVLGNYGLNSFFKPTIDHPVEIYANDYDKNGSFDPITTVYMQDESYILHPRNLMIDQIPSFEYRFRTFDKYSTTPFNLSFTEEEINSSLHLQCDMLQSIILEKKGNNSFEIHSLPNESQFAPVYGIAFDDFNQDGLPDLFLIGNSYAEETVYGYYDASFGSVLLNQGDFSWRFLENNQINLIADGDKKALSKVMIGDGLGYIMTENGGFLQAFIFNQPPGGSFIELEEDDWYALVEYENGEIARFEFYHGAGYLSQDSRILIKEPQMKGVKIVKYSGKLRNF